MEELYNILKNNKINFTLKRYKLIINHQPNNYEYDIKSLTGRETAASKLSELSCKNQNAYEQAKNEDEYYKLLTKYINTY